MSNIEKMFRSADNVYITSCFIVVQSISLEASDVGCNRLHSEDFYLLRDKQLDKIYTKVFDGRKDLRGKRIHTTTYIRHYIL